LIVYLDTSALVKLYVSEPGAEAVTAWVTEAEAAAVSWVAYAEARAAFARALREGLTTHEAHLERVAQLNRDWEALMRVQLSPAIARSAGDLAEGYGLRGFDAIHLASALWLRDKAAGDLALAAFDGRLRGAAARAGLRVLGQGA
jgi:predicted nucleic acid-binding protein